MVILQPGRLLVTVLAVILVVTTACSGGEDEDTDSSSGSSQQAPASVQDSTSVVQPTATVPVVEDQPKLGGTFTPLSAFGLGPLGDPRGWDPHKNSSSRTSTNLNMVYSKLLQSRFGPDSNETDFTPVGDLVETWEQLDATTYVFQLHKGVKFQNKPPVNGRELTSADVKFTLERLDKEAPYAKFIMGGITSIETPDRYTVKLTLDNPDASFLVHLSSEYGTILAEEAGGTEQDWREVATAIGSGPFILESWDPGVKTVYTKNPDYFKEDDRGIQLPYLDKVVFTLNTDAATRLAILRTGKGDVSSVGIDDLGSLKGTNPDMVFRKYTSNIVSMLDMRIDKAPFSDIRVRRAISMALDRQGYIDGIYSGDGVLQIGMPTAWTDWFIPFDQYPPELRQFYEYNPEGAKDLLAKAGFANGFEVEFEYFPGFYATQGDLWSDLLSKVGIRTKVKTTDYTQWSTGSFVGKYEEITLNPGGPGMEVSDHMYAWYHTGEGWNRQHISDPKLDKFAEAQRSATDPVERKKILDEMQLYIAEMAYRIMHPQGFSHYAYHPWVKDFWRKTHGDSGRVAERIWLDR